LNFQQNFDCESTESFLVLESTFTIHALILGSRAAKSKFIPSQSQSIIDILLLNRQINPEATFVLHIEITWTICVEARGHHQQDWLCKNAAVGGGVSAHLALMCIGTALQEYNVGSTF